MSCSFNDEEGTKEKAKKREREREETGKNGQRGGIGTWTRERVRGTCKKRVRRHEEYW